MTLIEAILEVYTSPLGVSKSIYFKGSDVEFYEPNPKNKAKTIGCRAFSRYAVMDKAHIVNILNAKCEVRDVTTPAQKRANARRKAA